MGGRNKEISSVSIPLKEGELYSGPTEPYLTPQGEKLQTLATVLASLRGKDANPSPELKKDLQRTLSTGVRSLGIQGVSLDLVLGQWRELSDARRARIMREDLPVVVRSAPETVVFDARVSSPMS